MIVLIISYIASQCMYVCMYAFMYVCKYTCDQICKTGLICTKYTYSFYHIYLFFCVGYTISVSFIEFLCVYDEIFDKVLRMLGKSY